MARGFRPGCPLTSSIKATVLRESTARKGTCTTCEILEKLTQPYRSRPCPHMKWTGIYIKKRYRK